MPRKTDLVWTSNPVAQLFHECSSQTTKLQDKEMYMHAYIVFLNVATSSPIQIPHLATSSPSNLQAKPHTRQIWGIRMMLGLENGTDSIWGRWQLTKKNLALKSKILPYMKTSLSKKSIWNDLAERINTKEETLMGMYEISKSIKAVAHLLV